MEATNNSGFFCFMADNCQTYGSQGSSVSIVTRLRTGLSGLDSR